MGINITSAGQTYAVSQVIDVMAYNTITQGTFAAQAVQGTSTVDYFDFSNSATQANGDGLTYKCFLKSGNYTLGFGYYGASVSAIIKIAIDGTVVATIDAYTAAGDDWKFSRTPNVAVSSTGIKTISVYADGKNAGSAAYLVGILNIGFNPE